MKRKLGPYPYLYPQPMVIVGATVNGKANYTTVAYSGVLQHKPALISISLSKTHYSNIGIKENKCFSVNIPNTKMMRVTDFLGMYSGRKIDKSQLFEAFYGDLEYAPMITIAPVNLECKLVDVLDYDGTSEIFVGEIKQTYSEDRFMRNGLLNMKRIDPFVFSIHTNFFYNIGKKIGKGWYSGLRYKSKVKINLD